MLIYSQFYQFYIIFSVISLIVKQFTLGENIQAFSQRSYINQLVQKITDHSTQVNIYNFDSYICYSTYCSSHRSFQDLSYLQHITSFCPVCLEEIVTPDHKTILKTPCCKNVFLHKECVQVQYFFFVYYWFYFFKAFCFDILFLIAIRDLLLIKRGCIQLTHYILFCSFIMCKFQMQATASGYFFKCPTCNNQDQFQEEMARYGIYIPQR